MVGCACGYACGGRTGVNAAPGKEKQVTGQDRSKTAAFGLYDGRSGSRESFIGWEAGPEFMPLDCDMPDEEQEFLFYLCAGYGIDFSLVMALIENESGYDPGAVSPTEDYGLMQINVRNHEQLKESIGITDFLDPYQNMRAGCFVLGILFEKYRDTEMVLMAYNMGESGAACLWKKGVFETDYTRNIRTVQGRLNAPPGGE